jgi:hypothetical protein
MFLFVYFLALVLLGACWLVGDVEVRTKIILTLVYAASWALLLVGPYFLVAAHALYSIVVGMITFGPNMGRR